MQEIRFDYFRGMEADQYTFYRIPKMLFTAECFRDLSCEAKVLYGLLLDRMGLSVRNRWFDDENRVYIIFKVEEIMELMCCKSQKATKLMKELDTEGIEPMSHIFPVENVFRQDVVADGSAREEILTNAPREKNGCFQVPKTL